MLSRVRRNNQPLYEFKDLITHILYIFLLHRDDKLINYLSVYLQTPIS